MYKTPLPLRWFIPRFCFSENSENSKPSENSEGSESSDFSEPSKPSDNGLCFPYTLGTLSKSLAMSSSERW